MYSDRRHQQQPELFQQNKTLSDDENLSRKLNHHTNESQISERYQMGSNSNSDTEENQGKNYCFVQMYYRNSILVKPINELKVVQDNQIIYKGCLQNGDLFTFKSRKDSNKSTYKLVIYCNNSFEDELISCCEYGLMHDDLSDTFQVEQIIGSQPCKKCQSKQNFPLSVVRSWNEASEKEVDQQLAETKTLASFASNPSKTKEIHSSETNHVLSNFKLFEEENIVFNSLDGDSPLKKTNGPPQLSSMLSFNEHSSPSIPTSPSTSSEMTDHNSYVLTNQDRNTRTSNSILQRYQDENNGSVNSTIETEERTRIYDDLFLSNNFFESLSNYFYNMLFRMTDNIAKSSNTIHREKGNVEWFNLVYLHSTSLDPSIVQRIRRLINIVKIFNDADDCIAYINSLSNQKIILILSDNFCDSFLPRIENAFYISSIYILSENPDENLTFSSTQIRGVYRSIDDIYEMISDDINPIKSDPLIFQPVYTNRNTLDSTFLFIQLLGDILLDHNETENAFQELVHFARQEYEGNEYELAQIEEFEKSYKSTQAMSWFSRQCFLLKMLYRAFYLHEVDTLFKLRLFIQDLNAEIAKETIIEPISVYLGNTIEQSEIDSIEALSRNRNLITFDQLLFGTTDQSQAIARAKKISPRTKEFLSLLIRIDFPSATKCLIRLHQNSSLNNNEINIFINAGTMTKIITIEKDYPEKGCLFMHLQFVSYADEINLQEEIQAARNEIPSSSPLFRLAILLLKVNHQSYAEEFFSNLVNEDFLINDTKRQTSLSQSLELLALTHFQKENYKRASELFLLCLKAYRRFLPIYSSSLYLTYRDLGESFYRVAEYQLAIDYFQQALDTQFYSNNPDLFCSAFCCFKLGLIYFKQGNNQNAIQALGRAEKILEESGETHRTELIAIYNTLATYYFEQGKYDDAIIYCKKNVEIQQSIQPNDSRELYATHFFIATMYLDSKNYRNAMIYYERSFDYAREYLPEKHYNFVLLHNNIGYTYYEEKQYSSALNHYSKGLSLASECLPDNHDLIGTLLSNTALVYSNIGRFDEAIETMEKSIEQLRKTLPDDNIRVNYKRTLLDGIKRKKILHEVIGETFQYF